MADDIETIQVVFKEKLSPGECTVHALLQGETKVETKAPPDSAGARLALKRAGPSPGPIYSSLFLLCLQGAKGWATFELPYGVHRDSVAQHPNNALARSQFGYATPELAVDFKGLGRLPQPMCWILAKGNRPPVLALVPGPAQSERPTPRQLTRMWEKGGSWHAHWEHDAVGVWWLADIVGWTSDPMPMPILGMGPNTRELAGPQESSGNAPARLFHVEANPVGDDGKLKRHVPSSPEHLWAGGMRGYVYVPTLDVIARAISRGIKRQRPVAGEKTYFGPDMNWVCGRLA